MSRVLIVAAHPDDEILGCGGTMARHARLGDELYVAIVTRGVPEIFAPEGIARTRSELVDAHKAVGGVKRVSFLDFPAPKLDVVPGCEIAAALRKVVVESNPSTVYLPHGGDLHADHRVTYLATLVACRPTPTLKPALLCYETLSETEWAPPSAGAAFIPNVFVDISADLPAKLAAMSCYRSQLREAPHPRSLDAIQALAHFRGATVCLAAAEAFELVRQTIP